MWITANLLHAMVYDGAWARRSYREPFHRSAFASYPKLSNVDFPTVAVAKAVYDPSAKQLAFALVINAPTDAGDDTVSVDTKGMAVGGVTLNGAPFTDWTQPGAGSAATLSLKWSGRAEVVVSFT